MMRQEETKERKADYPILPLLLNRWSPRSMSGEEISDDELMSLFEAARWAPSSYNNQPWRFLYAKKDAPEWPLFFNLLVPFNQEWTKNASALLLIASSKVFAHNKKPCHTHSFDTGAAWMSLCLEGAHRGLVVHGMEGFDYEKARTDLEIPDNYQVEAMAAIGKPAPKEALPQELQQKETPSSRNPLSQMVMHGKFQKQ